MAKLFKKLIPKFGSTHKPFTVLVEGNIGAGKSSFLFHFEKNENVDLFPEPVEKWRDVRGENLLVCFFQFVYHFLGIRVLIYPPVCKYLRIVGIDV